VGKGGFEPQVGRGDLSHKWKKGEFIYKTMWIVFQNETVMKKSNRNIIS